MAPPMLTIPTLVGRGFGAVVGAGAGLWAAARAARPKIIVGTARFFFKLQTPKRENTTIFRLHAASGASESPADRETEHRPLFEERHCLTKRRHGIGKRSVVGKGGAV